jgi:hypothetical protein
MKAVPKFVQMLLLRESGGLVEPQVVAPNRRECVGAENRNSIFALKYGLAKADIPFVG